MAYTGLRINYSEEKIASEEYRIIPHSLLFENKIVPQQIDGFTWDGYPVFFKTNGDLPFDILAASFYLLSRYEEYLPHEKDEYGRYAHKNSLAFQQGFLNQPLVNNWIKSFKAVLKEKFPAASFLSNERHSSFVFLPTYDIDMAWSFRHKGAWRNMGGFLRALLKGNWRECGTRIKVLRGKEKDPYDAYGWMNHLHEQYKIKPYYFFLVAEKNGTYDKNIHPGKQAMKDLIRDHAIRYPVGIHPSWQSGDRSDLLKKEIGILSSASGGTLRSSRQHYIRLSLPETFRHLLAENIQFDFSMGYGSINGFRASVASPFYWYDLPGEQQTALLLFPYCFMEANSFYEQKITATQALDEMRHYYQAVKAVNGHFIMIWHNHFLGTDPVFAGWREIYETFIRETCNPSI